MTSNTTANNELFVTLVRKDMTWQERSIGHKAPAIALTDEDLPIEARDNWIVASFLKMLGF
jgi:hypothetical protein